MLSRGKRFPDDRAYGWPLLKVVPRWLAAQPSILRARDLRVLVLPHGRMLVYTPIRHWSHNL